MSRVTVCFRPQDLTGPLKIPLWSVQSLRFPCKVRKLSFLSVHWPYSYPQIDNVIDGHILLSVQGHTPHLYTNPITAVSATYTWIFQYNPLALEGSVGHFSQTNLDESVRVDENLPELDITMTFCPATVAWFAALPQCPTDKACSLELLIIQE